MFKSLNQEVPTSKCFLSSGSFPRFIDSKQPPTKRKPFSTIMSQPYNHTTELILPKELYQIIWPMLEGKLTSLHYSRVIMPLSALLDGEFFNHYIKTGNVMMLSEGRPGIDDTYSLKDGILRLNLAKETYERTGLVGKPIRDAGRKHLKTRYAIELNLRLPSMLHGKKGFDRILHAFTHVLTNSLTWLFYDFHPPTPPTPSSPTQPPEQQQPTTPLSPHHPLQQTVLPTTTTLKSVLVSPLTCPPTDDLDALALLEYFSLVSLQSPRIFASDTVDPFLCRYEVPEAEKTETYDLVCVKWRGFIPAVWVRGLIVELVKMQKKCVGPRGWWTVGAYAFETEAVGAREGWTVLKLGDAVGEEGDGIGDGTVKDKDEEGGRYVLWEMER